MDLLSGAASIIAVIQITQSVSLALKDYYEDVRDARDDIRKLYNSVKNLEAILSQIQDLLNQCDGHRFYIMNLFTDSSGPLRQLEFELHKLQLELKVSPKNQRGLGKAVQSLAWPFKKKEVEKSIFTIDQHKSNLILEIGIENL